MKVVIRKAERQDVPLLLEFIRGIARYEKMENEVIASADVLEQEIFDEHRAEAVFAVVDGHEVGFALYFYNFSTFIGHSGLYLEDLFVWPEDRGKGYGKALLLHLVKIAREAASGQDSSRASLWTDGMVVSELEPAKHRFLPFPRSRAYEGVDGVSVGCYRIGATIMIFSAF